MDSTLVRQTFKVQSQNSEMDNQKVGQNHNNNLATNWICFKLECLLLIFKYDVTQTMKF